MDGNIIATIVASCISGLAIIAGLIQWIFSNIKSDKHKQLDEIYDKLYVELPTLISELLHKEDPSREDTKKIKTYILKELIPRFIILRFRSEKKYSLIITRLRDLEDSVVLIRENNVSIEERKNNIKKDMKKLYKTVDRIFHFN